MAPSSWEDWQNILMIRTWLIMDTGKARADSMVAEHNAQSVSSLGSHTLMNFSSCPVHPNTIKFSSLLLWTAKETAKIFLNSSCNYKHNTHDYVSWFWSSDNLRPFSWINWLIWNFHIHFHVWQHACLQKVW